VPSPSGPAELLSDLSRVLERLGVPWYVFGAQAALIWGRPRMTADVDVTVRLDRENTPEALVDALHAGGFRMRFGSGRDFVRQTRVLPLVHPATDLALDIVLAGPGLEDLFLSRAVNVAIGGAAVPVIGPEDLVATKILAGRSKDIEDIRGVLAERGDRLDLEMIRATLRSLEEALGQSDLLPVLEAELARWKPR
jgi:hypothetical protein